MIVIDAAEDGESAMRIGNALIGVVNGEQPTPSVAALCNVCELIADFHPAYRRAIINQLRSSADRLEATSGG